jgi:hypothetical protein
MSDSNNNNDSLTNDLTTHYNKIFSKNTVILIIWFLALNVVCSYLLKFFFNNNIESLDYQSKLGRLLDICIFVFLFFFIIASYYSITEQNKETIIENMTSSVINYIKDSNSIYKTIVFILFFYCIIYLFRIPMNYQTKPYFISGIEIITWVLLLITVFVKFFNDVFGFSMIDIISSFLNWSNLPGNSSKTTTSDSKKTTPQSDSFEPSVSTDSTSTNVIFQTINNLISNLNSTTSAIRGSQNKNEGFDLLETTTPLPIPAIVSTDSTKPFEVFNVQGDFTYDDAQLVCAAYGAKIANYDQIEDTYQNGGEWCNYGWSEGQNAYFPTQKSTWLRLQKNSDPAIRKSCGRQGINGGYIDDPTQQMGTNCFGPKPELKDIDLLANQQQANIIHAKSQQEIELDNKIKFWKEQIDNGSVQVNHYNQALWSVHDNNVTLPPVSTLITTRIPSTTTFAPVTNIQLNTDIPQQLPTDYSQQQDYSQDYNQDYSQQQDYNQDYNQDYSQDYNQDYNQDYSQDYNQDYNQDYSQQQDYNQE